MYVCFLSNELSFCSGVLLEVVGALWLLGVQMDLFAYGFVGLYTIHDHIMLYLGACDT